MKPYLKIRPFVWRQEIPLCSAAGGAVSFDRSASYKTEKGHAASKEHVSTSDGHSGSFCGASMEGNVSQKRASEPSSGSSFHSGSRLDEYRGVFWRFGSQLSVEKSRI